jgi:hypothetical protein
MPRFRKNATSTLIARPGYAGFGGTSRPRSMGGFFDGLFGGFAQGVTTQANQSASQTDIAAALAAQSGPGIGTYALIGGGVLAAYLLLKKKKR